MVSYLRYQYRHALKRTTEYRQSLYKGDTMSTEGTVRGAELVGRALADQGVTDLNLDHVYELIHTLLNRDATRPPDVPPP